MSARVLIVGATSAIAESLARLFAIEGAQLYLAARNGKHLASIADDLKVRGAGRVLIHAFEATSEDGASLSEAAWEALGSIDVAVIAHGTLPRQTDCQNSSEMTRQALTINALSVLELLTPLANRMEAAGSGDLAVISSVAGDRGRQSNYVYGSAKACLNVYLQGLRHRLSGSGVNVLTVKPGFVDTPMTKTFEKGPLWASPEQVAWDIRRAIARRRTVIYTPWFWRWIMLIIRLVPTPVFHRTKL